MRRTYLPRHLLVNAGGAVAQPPPDGISSIAFLSRFLLVSLGVMMAVALIVSAPVTVALPLGIVLVGYAIATAGVTAVDRARRRRPDAAVAPTVIPGRWGALLGLSLLFLVLAVVVPERIGSVLAPLGFIGLLTYRVTAVRRGWFPRR